MEDQYKPVRNNDVIWREIDGETAIISSDNKKMMILNDVGSRMWNLMDGKSTLAAIASLIAGEYGVSEEMVKQDIMEYAAELERQRLIEENRDG